MIAWPRLGVFQQRIAYMDGSREVPHEIVTHQQLEYHLKAAQEALEQAQKLDRQLYTVARFSKAISSALRAVSTCVQDAEIINRCGSLSSGLSREAVERQ